MFTGEVVAFAGDWHGDRGWGAGRIKALAELGVTTLLHVGDFGIWTTSPGKRYLMGIERACLTNGVTVLVTPGNHEDWNRLDLKQVKDKGDGWGAVKHMTDHIKVLPRGHRFTMTTPSGTTRSLVSLGGAPSVDYLWRTEGRDWFPTEMITPEDVALTVAGGHADIMIAHDSPGTPYAVSGVEDILKTNPMGFPDQALAYATVGRNRMTTAYEGVAPKLFFHGHYHVTGTRLVTAHGEPERWVVSLDQQNRRGNIAFVNLDTLQVL
jgi:hypothetical protein